MLSRHVELTDALNAYVEERVRSGAYQDASDVMRAALRLLKADELAREAQLDRLRSAVQAGVDDIEAGRYTDVEWEELDAWIDTLGRPTPAE